MVQLHKEDGAYINAAPSLDRSCATLTEVVVTLGLVAGPAVDLLHKPHGLRLDCFLESSQALLQAVLAEAHPR